MRIYINKTMTRLLKLLNVAIFLLIIVYIYKMSNEWKSTSNGIRIFAIKQKRKELVGDFEVKVIYEKTNISNLKFILQWTNPKHVPFVYMGVGQQGFIDRKCKYTNCFVTSDKDLLGDVSKFDVVAFAGPEVSYTPNNKLTPTKRSPHQKYAFASIESAGNYPICSKRLNKFFNWTWTYRLDSESKWGYIIVRDAENKIIGPKVDMHWMKLKDMDPVSKELAAQLRNKTIAAAWFVSNCKTANGRELFAKALQEELNKYDLKIDVYGNCGLLRCDRDKEECLEIIKRDYYFYLSFENSNSEDYVTEKLLYGLKNNAVPIVYGGANYTRFMPDGIYLNAQSLGFIKLAKKMKYLIDHPEEYKEYFRWKSHYSYYKRDESAETDDYCGFCSLLNNEEMVKKSSIYKNFEKWWNAPNHCSSEIRW